MRRITRPLLILLAIVFLIEAWLWRHLEPIVERIVAWLPLRAVKAAIAGVIRKLPPYATLIVFLVPMAALFPLKLLGLWLLANKHWFAARLILIFAKLVGLAITAFVFEVTKPKLLKMAWFRRIYEHVLIWLEWARALVDPIRLRMRRLLVLVRGERGRRAIRLLWRIRRRMNRERRLAGKPVSADAAGVARAAQAS
ncbi:MAG: hypothetical protein WCG92_15400 [Hyphomicrobiales bacterium]